MTLFAWPDSTRGQIIVASFHVAMLVGTLAFAWTRDGPPSETAFWAILFYFCEIAVVGIGEVIVSMIRPPDEFEESDEFDPT